MAVVLVADGEQRAALAVVRSLGAAGHQVYVCSHHAPCLAGASRHSRASELVPNPLEQPTAYAAAVANLVGRWHIDAVVPNTDAALLALLPARDCIDANIPWPSLEAFQNICDKSRVAEAAQTLGIGVPKQLRLESAGARGQPHRVSYRIRWFSSRHGRSLHRTASEPSWACDTLQTRKRSSASCVRSRPKRIRFCCKSE